jgi:hypothetical protein
LKALISLSHIGGTRKSMLNTAEFLRLNNWEEE